MSGAVLSPQAGWALLALFGALWIALGVFWGRKAKDAEGYMLAGRNVGMALGTATAMATWVTSNTTMLAPVFALEKGVWGMLAYSTASFGLFLFAPMAFRIHQLLPKGVTSGDFFRLRYGTAAWTIYLLITLVYSMGWLVTMAIAGGEFFAALAGIEYAYGMSVILFVCVVYTVFGGLFAVIGTDFIQSLIILVGIVAVGALVLARIDLPEVYQSVRERQPALLDMMMPAALLAVFNNMFFGFGEVFHNNVWWSRAFAMRRKVAPKAFFLSGFLWFPIPVAAGFIALSAGPLGINIAEKNMTGPLVASQILSGGGPSLVAGALIFVVLFCSLASSLDSLLAATSDLLTQDIYRKLFGGGGSDRAMRAASILIVIAVGVFTWIAALQRWPLEKALFFSGPLVASVIWPVIGGLYWKRCGRAAVIAAMLLGSGVGLGAYFAIGWFVASLVGAAVSMVATLLGRWLAPDDFDRRRLDESATETSAAEGGPA